MADEDLFEKGWDDLTDNNPGNKTKWYEEVEQFDWGDKKVTPWLGFRPVGGVLPMAQHGFETKSKKFFRLFCLNFDPRTETFQDRGCPACMIEACSHASRTFFMNVIDRGRQAKGDTRYVVLLQLPGLPMSSIRKLRDLLPTNPETGRKYSVSDPQHGCDIMMMYDGNANSPSEYYSIQKGDSKPLTQQEMSDARDQAYKLISTIKVESRQEIADAMLRNGYIQSLAEVNMGDAPQQSQSLGAPQQQAPVQQQMQQAPVQQPMQQAPQQQPMQQAPQQQPMQQAPQQQPMQQAPQQQAPGAELKSADCPADFGQYVGKIPCLQCKARPQCIEQSSQS